MKELHQINDAIGCLVINKTHEIIYIDKTAKTMLNIDSKIDVHIAETIKQFNASNNHSTLILENDYFLLLYKLMLDNEISNYIILTINISEMKKIFKYNENENDFNDKKIDFLIDFLNTEVTVTDGEGIMKKVSKTYCKNYGAELNDIIGHSVFELEEKGIFYPSSTIKALNERQKVTVLQKNKLGKTIMATAVPIFDEDDEIQYVVSYDSWDVRDATSLKEKYESIQSIVEHQSQEIKLLRQKEIKIPNIVAESKNMKELVKLAHKLSEVDANILITGETGVGKNVFARLIHNLSYRKNEAFIEINCGSIPPSLIESELFGYERGSFTGANTKGKVGQMELSNKGTLFLDEVSEFPLNSQATLLKVIQEKSIIRVGGISSKSIDFRLISATNSDLMSLVQSGMFRKDLYYRINVFPIFIPPLRERIEDIIPLSNLFLKKANKKYNRNIILIENAKKALTEYTWPGNIRELENIIDRLVLTIEKDIIKEDNIYSILALTPSINLNRNMNLKDTLDYYEEQLLREAYSKHKTTLDTAKALGTSQPTVSRKLRKYKII